MTESLAQLTYTLLAIIDLDRQNRKSAEAWFSTHGVSSTGAHAHRLVTAYVTWLLLSGLTYVQDTALSEGPTNY